jgi:purine-cytosine permease-like protein
MIVLAVMAGTAGPKFNLASQSVGSPETVHANRLSFFSLALSCPIAWAPAGADFYVYYPPNTLRWKTFLMSFVGLGLAIIVTLLLGVGLGSAVDVVPEWSDAYNITPGNLIEPSYLPVNGFGKFCAVVVALGVISNNVPGTYSAALSFQMLGRYGLAVPRTIWTCVGVIIYTACALGGRNSLFDIFENFLPLMGYWIVIWLTIVIQEDLIFRRNKPYDWEAWNDRRELPWGIAALTAFLIGWVGAIVGMVRYLLFTSSFVFGGDSNVELTCRLFFVVPSVLCWTNRSFDCRWLRRRHLPGHRFYILLLSSAKSVGTVENRSLIFNGVCKGDVLVGNIVSI